MRDRTFDPKKILKGKKYFVSQDEIDEIREEAKKSQILLENDFFIRYLQQAQDEILDMTAKQMVYDVEEQTVVNDTVKTIKFPAAKEYKMIAGEFRFIERFKNDLRMNVEMGKLLEEKIASGEVEVQSVEQ